VTDARRWLAAASAGAVGGLLAGLYWQFAHGLNASCEAHACWFPFFAAGWAIGGGLVPTVTWLLLLVAGYRGGAQALLVAVLGSVVFGIGARAYDAFVYGSPRPPYVLLAILGAGAFLAAVALVSGHLARLLAGGFVVMLAAGLVVGEITSPQRDRLHRFAALASVARVPDSARWRVTKAEAYPRYDAIELSLAPAGGGPAITMLELPEPAGWDPPQRCGPGLTALALKIAIRAAGEVHDTGCTAYAGGGWQRSSELLDLRAGALVMAGAASEQQPVSPAYLREVLTSLRPATPKQMAELP
jgi:hypothetical protein